VRLEIHMSQIIIARADRAIIECFVIRTPVCFCLQDDILVEENTIFLSKYLDVSVYILHNVRFSF
jgi:hypothetical protein